MRNNMKKEQIKDFKKSLRKSKYTVYSTVRHVSPSGMSRVIHFFLIINGGLYHIDYMIEKLLGYKADKNYDGLRVGGCGMDMCFHVVYLLSCKLYCPDKYNHDSAYKLKSHNI